MSNKINRGLFTVESDLLSSNLNIPQLSPKQIELDNGLKLYVFEDNNMDVVKLEFVFNMASMVNQKKVYTSVVTNSLLTEGSKRYSAIEIANAIDFHGAFIDKVVEKESSCIVFYFLKKYQDNLLPWFEQIIKEAIMLEHEMEIYLNKLRQQYLVSRQKTDYLARVGFYETVFGTEHPLGKNGTLEDFDLLKREDLLDFYSSFYSSSYCSLIAAGNIDDNFIYSINKFFGGNDWSRKDVILNTRTDFPLMMSKKEIINVDKAVQSSIRIGKKTISSKHEDYMGLNVLNCLLGGYFGSRLMSNIREDKGFTYGIGSALQSFEQEGVFFVSADVKAENCSQAIEEVYKEIELLSKESVSVSELNMVKSFLIGNILRSLDGSFELSDRFKPLLKYGFEWDYYQKYIEKIRSITPQELKCLSRKYLSIEGMSEIRVGNENIMK